MSGNSNISSAFSQGHKKLPVIYYCMGTENKKQLEERVKIRNV